MWTWKGNEERSAAEMRKDANMVGLALNYAAPLACELLLPGRVNFTLANAAKPPWGASNLSSATTLHIHAKAFAFRYGIELPRAA